MAQDLNTTKEQGLKLFVPGRVCLFGEHSDWAAEYGIHRGFCIVIGTDQSITAIVNPCEDFVIETLIPDILGRPTGRTRQMSCPWDSDALLSIAKNETDFFRYCAGVAHVVLKKLNISNGVHIRIKTISLPLKKGVSSSAAVCILVAKAFDAIYKLRLLPHELMELAYLGERLTGSQCGRMDQACIYGKIPVLLMFEKRKDIRIEPIFTVRNIYMFFVDLAGKKDTVKILADLQNNYLSNEILQHALGKQNERIVRLAYQSILNSDAAELGELMKESQDNFDQFVAPNSPKQLASPLLHKVLNFKGIAEHIYGGKGVGSQGDGTAQFVARTMADRDTAMEKIEAAFPQMKCYVLTIQNWNSSH